MSISQGMTSFKFWVDIAMPTAAQLPSYLGATDYQNPCDNQTTAFAHAFGSEFWTWLEQNPGHAATFNGFMGSRREGRPSWFDTYPVEKELKGFGEGVGKGGKDAVALVDIGGNQGHDLVNLKAKYPDLRGRFVLQDLPDVVAKARLRIRVSRPWDMISSILSLSRVCPAPFFPLPFPLCFTHHITSYQIIVRTRRRTEREKDYRQPHHSHL